MPATALEAACHLNVLVPGLGDPGFGAALDALAEAGYRRVVLPPVDPAALDVPALRSRFADRGLIPIPIAGQSPDADVSSPDPAVASAGSAALIAMARFAAELGSDQLNGVPYGLFGRAAGPPSGEAVERSARAVGTVADAAHELGVTMTFEVLNRYETAFVNTAAQAVDYVRLSGSDHLRIHLDTFHMAIEEADMLAAVRAAVPILGYLELGQSGRGALGAGVVDNAAVVAAAWGAGYRGPIGVEAFSRDVIGPFAGDILAIWRDPAPDGAALAREAIAIIRRGVVAAG